LASRRRWVIDFGAPGPDRGEGGKYVLLPLDYDGVVPQGGYYVARSLTTRVPVLGREFLVNSDPRSAVDLIKSRAKVRPSRSTISSWHQLTVGLFHQRLNQRTGRNLPMKLGRRQ